MKVSSQTGRNTGERAEITPLRVFDSSGRYPAGPTRCPISCYAPHMVLVGELMLCGEANHKVGQLHQDSRTDQ